jgi:uncharacterized radical SAM protein YgiQ
MFIPTTDEEVRARGWDGLDIILVSGDTYTDNSYNGTAIIGHWLIHNGFRAGIIAQPDIGGPEDITRLGMPELFWSVSAGCVDSMVANYTSIKKFRKQDDFTPGGMNTRRPDRACIAYSNLIKKHAKGRPIVLGGIEASLRRVAHYDFWSDSVRRSILFDSKADAITYGMSELSNLQVAQRMRDGADWKAVPGICYASNKVPEGHIIMPSYQDCVSSGESFRQAFRVFRDNCDPVTARGLAQDQGGRFLIQNPPQRLLTSEELDTVYGLDYENAVHPYYLKDGPVKAMETVRNSVTTHRGCYGDCSFCAIAAHQGRTVVSRSEDSIVSEVERLASRPGFNGTIQDVGGPTANMYGIECGKKLRDGICTDRRCLGDSACPSLRIDHGRQIELLRRIRDVPGVRKVFVNSGIRYDMILADKETGQDYLAELVRHHVSGQMKVAPEHVSRRVLRTMGKPGPEKLLEFKSRFDRCALESGKDLYLTYYFIAAHPGCRDEDMKELSRFCRSELRLSPEQVQIFTPTPSTVSTCMFHTGADLDGKAVFSEHSTARKLHQKEMVVRRKDARHRRLRQDKAPGRASVRQAFPGPQAHGPPPLRLPDQGRMPVDGDVRLPGARSRQRVQGRRQGDRPVVPGEAVRPAGIRVGVYPFGGLHSPRPPQVPEEGQDAGADPAGENQEPPGLGGEAAGFRAGHGRRPQELVHHMGHPYAEVPFRPVQPGVQGGVGQSGPGPRRCPGQRGGFRRVP